MGWTASGVGEETDEEQYASGCSAFSGRWAAMLWPLCGDSVAWSGMRWPPQPIQAYNLPGSALVSARLAVSKLISSYRVRLS